MKKITLLCVTALICLYFKTNGQRIKPLSVGDMMSPELQDIVYNKNPPVPTLFEFFLTTCGSCVKLMPHLNQLQKQHGDSLNIQLVSSETKQKLKQFFSQNSIAKTNRLSIIAEDSLLSQYFPFEAVPHTVWVSGNGKIQAISGPEYLTEKNVQNLVRAQPLDIPPPGKEIVYDPLKNLYDQAIGHSGNIYYSVFTGYLKGTKNNLYGNIQVNEQTVKQYYVNMGALSILQQLLGGISTNRFCIHPSLVQQFINPSNDPAWFLNHFYCYEFTYSKSLPPENKTIFILNDLSRYLNVSISIDSIATSCYVLKKSNGTKSLLSSKGGSPETNLFTPPSQEKILRNQPISRLVKAMNSGKWEDNRPVVLDETGIHYPVDIILPVSSVQNIPEMKKALQPYGLQLEPAARVIPVVVINPFPNKNP